MNTFTTFGELASTAGAILGILLVALLAILPTIYNSHR